MPTSKVATSASSDAADEIAGQRGEGRGEIGAEHVERAVRQIDEIHDAEHERQAGGKQEQQQAELQAVQALFDKQQHGLRCARAPAAMSHALKKRDGSGSQAPAVPRRLNPYHFIGHFLACSSWLSLTMVATVFSVSSPSASFTTSCR